MRIPSLARRTLAVASAAAAVAACDRGEPAAAPAPAETPAPAAAAEPAVSAEPGPPEAVVIPPFDPSLPPLKLEPPPIPEPRSTPRAKARGAPPRAPASADTTASAEPDHVPLDALFRASYGQPPAEPTIDLAPAEADPVTSGPKPPRALDRLGDSIRLERRGEAIGPAGPRQGTAWETDAGVRIPVDNSISLEGGVRVESREEPGAKQKDEARRMPKVGVEVRF